MQIKNDKSILIKTPIKLATVFSGIGAVEYAARRLDLDYDLIFASDNDKYVQKSYFANYRPQNKSWFDDIKHIDGYQYKNEVDLLVGGSPCQSFSLVGSQGGFFNQNGRLIFEFIRLIEEIQPKMFIFENVRGILRSNNGRDWKILQKSLNETGYLIAWKVINSKNHGIPQNRRRLFITGSKREIHTFQIRNRKLKIKLKDLCEDFAGHHNNGLVDYSKEFGLLGRYILKPRQKIPEKYYLSKKMISYVSSSGTKKFHSPAKFNLEVARPVLKTVYKMHRAGIDNYIKYPSERIRRLTPRECLRLMGFDDRFKIVVSDTQAYKQAGNSIVVDILIDFLLRIVGIDKKSIFYGKYKQAVNFDYSYQSKLTDYF